MDAVMFKECGPLPLNQFYLKCIPSSKFQLEIENLELHN